MSKSRNKSRSEVEYLRGKIRKLEAELKYHKKRAHFFEEPIDQIEIEEIEGIKTDQCPKCHRGVLISYDFGFAGLDKCSNCDFEQRYGKKY